MLSESVRRVEGNPSVHERPHVLTPASYDEGNRCENHSGYAFTSGTDIINPGCCPHAEREIHPTHKSGVGRLVAHKDPETVLSCFLLCPRRTNQSVRLEGTKVTPCREYVPEVGVHAQKNVVTSVFVVRPWRRLTREENKQLAYKSVSFENLDDTLLDPSACEPFAQAQGYQTWIRPLRVVNAPSFNEALCANAYLHVRSFRKPGRHRTDFSCQHKLMS